MAKTKSVLKRIRQNEKRRVSNVSIKTHVKTRVKAVLKAIEDKDVDKAKEVLWNTVSVIDKAASKGVLHKNNASRKISRLTRKINVLG